MCGIIGIIGSTNKDEIASLIEPISNRGNNDANCTNIDNNILGNILLEIIDKKNGTQPIYNKSRTKLIVFNGEIYNYKKLRIELISKGYSFYTNTDTEVILALYDEYKENLLDYLDGMFSFVIYDKINKQCFGARDHFGIKPLFYTLINSKLYFSSEMKSFIHLTDCTDIQELRPGQYFIFSQNTIRLSRYYNLNDINDSLLTFGDAKDKIYKYMHKSVHKRVQTNLPICIFFSGGIDSTIILYLAKLYHVNVKAFIIGLDNSEDVKISKKYCIENNVDYEIVSFTKKELLSSIPKIIYHIESFEPNVVRGATLSYLLSKKAHESGYKIALCGEGSDEIFSGYGDFLKLDNESLCCDLSYKLTMDLHRTQLLRVDRTSMAFQLEVRVPFLDKKVVELALSLPQKYKIGLLNNKKTTKFILREAFKEVLPSYIYSRQKMTLMHGSGADKVNREVGLFYDNATDIISDITFLEIKNNYQDFNIEDKETAYYFNIFKKHYPHVSCSTRRTINATTEIDE